jgi:AcrR family transcriptional regulator
MTKSEQAILKSAKALFWKFGFKKVTVEEICEQAGISKMTFYRKYSNKEHAAELLLQEILESNLRQYEEIMSTEKPFPDKVNQLLLLKHQESKSISPLFIQEIMAEDDSSLHQMIKAFTEKSYLAILTDIDKAKKDGWIREEIKSEFILGMLSTFRNKMNDEQFVYGLFKKR